MTKKLISIAMSALLIVSSVSSAIALDKSTLAVEAFDSIAGYSTVAEIENALPNEDVEVLMEKPNGSEIVISTETNESGDAKFEISGYHLKTAGIYTLQAKYTALEQSFGDTDSFKVYSDKLSLNKSSLQSDSATAEASGYDPVKLTVKLSDKYGNAIQGHNINIISSRNGDTVSPYEKTTTDEKGEVVFYAYSKQDGISTYTAYDITSGTVLENRAKVAYFSPISTLDEIGGDNLFTSILLADAATGGTVDHFEIEELDEEVYINELLNFTVTAYDETDQEVQDYIGEIRFSSSDDNADVPNDYTFTAEDQGSHTFSLNLRFTTTGTHTLTVTDTENRDVEGEIEIEVIERGNGSSSTTTSTEVAEDLAIINPEPGTYSSNTIEITGNAPYGNYVDIYDNGTVIETIYADPDNTFSIETSLDNGDHVLYVLAKDVDDVEYGMSEEVEITVDTQAPTLDYVEKSVEGDIEAESTFTLTVYSEPNLHQVGAILDDRLYELDESIDLEGQYSGILIAPSVDGYYSIDVILVDALANEIKYSDQSSVNVILTEEEIVEEEITTEEPIVEEEIIEEIVEEVEEVTLTPTAVTGVSAANGEGKVTLTWEAAIAGDESAYIKNYKIYYGPSEHLLYSTATTWDSSTMWYIPNLQADATYYFQVVAVDSNGVESETRSAIVSGMPKAITETTEEETSLGELHDSALEEMSDVSLEEYELPEETPDSGPEVLWVALFTLAFTHFYFRAKRRLA